jgi:hypothetical protein
VPSLLPANAKACTGHCRPSTWSSAFGPAVLREMYGSTHCQLLPPVAAVLILPESGLDVFRGDGLPVAVGGAGFSASADQLEDPRHARAAAAARHVLDARAGLCTGSGPTMWVNSSLAPDRLARLRHFVGEGSAGVLEHEL